MVTAALMVSFTFAASQISKVVLSFIPQTSLCLKLFKIDDSDLTRLKKMLMNDFAVAGWHGCINLQTFLNLELQMARGNL